MSEWRIGNRIRRRCAEFIAGELAIALALSVASCATRQTPAAGAGAQEARSETFARPSAASQAAPPFDASDSSRLKALWQERTSDSFGSDFSLGPGDVLEISVPLEELEHREVRVSPRDTITLPLVGVMQVKGLTEEGLTDALRERLSRYMYDPPVSLFVKHYGSRQVAVVGAVDKPGLYTLTSGSDTLMEMISKAGGTTKDSATNVIFVPAEKNRVGLQSANLIGVAQSSFTDAPGSSARFAGRDSQAEVGRVGPVLAGAAEPPALQHGRLPGLSAAAVAKLHPIVISMSDRGAQAYLEMPARPGDVLLIPAAGEVTVGGWVQTPGAYKVTPGMTALSAISAAGGAMFSSAAEVLRTGASGERLSIPVDISKVQSGEQSDVAMQSGDVVMVDQSAAGVIPYAAYEVFSKFGSGLMFPIP